MTKLFFYQTSDKFNNWGIGQGKEFKTIENEEFELIIDTVRPLHTENEEILKLLCETDEEMTVFINEFFDVNSFMSSMIDFRKRLFKSGKGQISALELQKIIDSRNRPGIIKTLEKLFLDPIGDAEMFMYDRAIKNGYNAIDIVNVHNVNPANRFVKVMKVFAGKKDGTLWRKDVSLIVDTRQTTKNPKGTILFR